jgi:hypothetical protein
LLKRCLTVSVVESLKSHLLALLSRSSLNDLNNSCSQIPDIAGLCCPPIVTFLISTLKSTSVHYGVQLTNSQPVKPAVGNIDWQFITTLVVRCVGLPAELTLILIDQYLA